MLGADLSHDAAGVSVAGVVASRDRHFVSYFSELRGQLPYGPSRDGAWRRKSEERIIDLRAMVSALLQRWRDANSGHLPEVVLHYRDGVSEGDFVDLLERERALLDAAFKDVGGTSYDPELAIILGQKRHHTRLFLEDARGVTAGHGAACAGRQGEAALRGRRGGDYAQQAPLGTVAGRGLAQPGHMNFFLFSQQGIQGTSVPCHYHVLHLDSRLARSGIGVDALERITYDLCALCSRAHKTVGYASPAYLAHHLCERGKLYLETQFGPAAGALGPSRLAAPCASAQGSTPEERERLVHEERQRAVEWLNQRTKNLGGLLQGRNFFL